MRIKSSFLYFFCICSSHELKLEGSTIATVFVSLSPIGNNSSLWSGYGGRDIGTDIGQIEEKRSSKRRGKDRYIRFTSDGQTIDGMQDSDNLSEDEQERRQSMEVLHWASNEFKTVFERPPEHLTELLEFLDTGREQTFERCPHTSLHKQR